MGVASLVTGKMVRLVGWCGGKLQRKIDQLDPTTKTGLASYATTRGSTVLTVPEAPTTRAAEKRKQVAMSSMFGLPEGDWPAGCWPSGRHRCTGRPRHVHSLRIGRTGLQHPVQTESRQNPCQRGRGGRCRGQKFGGRCK